MGADLFFGDAKVGFEGGAVRGSKEGRTRGTMLRCSPLRRPASKL